MDNNDREFLKANAWREWPDLVTAQKQQLPPPPLQKPYPEDAALFALVPPKSLTVGRMPLIEVITQRRSRRRFTEAALSLEELSFLLWATQGVRQIGSDGLRTFRSVPSGGARHAFETYLLVNRVDGLQPGLYRYLALDHKLCLLGTDYPALLDQLKKGCEGFVAQGAVVFIWTALPGRTEWRYGSRIGAKLIALDAGHVCQNLYLASESIGAGTCAIGDYNQEQMDRLVGADGQDEFVVYAAPVGKVG